MRTTISIIIIIILIIFLVILLHSSYYTETFISNKALNEIKNYKGKIDNNDTIEKPISDSLIPYNPKSKIELSEYDVIELFKSIMQRPPTISEMKKYVYLKSNELKELLYNSAEYDKLIKTQDNNVNNGIEGAIARKNIINRIMKIYSNVYKNELPIKMMLPLRDCFIYLQINEYLFIAMLESYNYKKFEADVLSTYVLTKKILLELFNKHFNALELKIIAQEKINKSNNIITSIASDINDIKSELLNITSIGGNDNITDYIKNTFPNVFNNLVSNTTTTEKYENKDINENNKLISNATTTEKYENKDINENNKLISNATTTEKYENNDIKEHLEINEDKIKKKVKSLPDDSEIYVRVYDPVTHNRSYLNDYKYKAPVCTSLGQKQLTQPIFTESKLLFQGMDLDKAFEDTQVGSIMPKFVYREYNDIKLN